MSGLSKIDAFGVGKLLDLKRLVLLFETIVSQTFGSGETNPENRVIGVEEMKVLSVESWIHQTQTTTEAQQVFSLTMKSILATDLKRISLFHAAWIFWSGKGYSSLAFTRG